MVVYGAFLFVACMAFNMHVCGMDDDSSSRVSTNSEYVSTESETESYNLPTVSSKIPVLTEGSGPIQYCSKDNLTTILRFAILHDPKHAGRLSAVCKLWNERVNDENMTSSILVINPQYYAKHLKTAGCKSLNSNAIPKFKEPNYYRPKAGRSEEMLQLTESYNCVYEGLAWLSWATGSALGSLAGTVAYMQKVACCCKACGTCTCQICPCCPSFVIPCGGPCCWFLLIPTGCFTGMVAGACIEGCCIDEGDDLKEYRKNNGSYKLAGFSGKQE